MADEIDKILNDEVAFQETVDYVFGQADTDGNGTIDASEFNKHIKEVYENIGLAIPDDDTIVKFMDELDTNKDGKLDKDEFKSYVKHMLEKDKEHNS